LKPVRLFVVKWSGIYNMIQCYIQLRPFLDVGVWVGMMPLLELLLTPVEHAVILSLFEDLKKFESVSKGLQKANGSLFEARSGCDWLMGLFPVTAAKLSPAFCDNRNRAFESAATKVQGYCENQLTVLESVALLPFLKEQGEEMVEEVDNNAEVLNFEEAVKRARLNAPGPVADGFRYVNLSYILVETTAVIYRISNFTVLW
jgi:hypothetical protein